MVRGRAEDVAKRNDGAYVVAVAGRAARVRARHVVFALGAAGAPNLPPPLAGAVPSARVIHTYDWARLLSAPMAGEAVVVVGGGLSAAQAALLAVRRGARRVVHASRRPVLSRPYDLPFDWMEARSRWGRVADRDKDKGGAAKFRMFEFHATPKAERAAWAKEARGGATVPAEYLKELERCEAAGKIERWVDEIATAEVRGKDSNTADVAPPVVEECATCAPELGCGCDEPTVEEARAVGTEECPTCEPESSCDCAPPADEARKPCAAEVAEECATCEPERGCDCEEPPLDKCNVAPFAFLKDCGEACDCAAPAEESGPIRLGFRHGGAISADRVVLATGSALDLRSVPLLDLVATKFDLPVAGSLPDLDKELGWGEEEFTVVGAFALLEMGPDAGNLTGCRRAAGVCADTLGAFESMQAGGPLANSFSVFQDDESSSSSDDSD